MTTGAENRVAVPFMDLGRQHAPLMVELRDAFERVVGASAFILGEEVERFEEAFSRWCRTAHCVGVGSGTAALQIMLEAAGVGRGDEVIVPAHTFIATALAVLHVGATPVPVDVDPGSGLIDPEAASAAINASTAAILAVHLYGQACAIDPLQELCGRHSLLLLEDAAQAHGAVYRGARAGSLGDAAAFSFYPSKNLGALGDGGAICTSDGDLATRARRLRDLGRDGDGAHAVAGYNERLDGLQAALLAVKLGHVDRWTRERRALAAHYRDLLHAPAEDGLVELLAESPASPCTYHLFPIRVGDRDALAAELRRREITTGIHYPRALPDQPPLRECVTRGEWPQGRQATSVARDWARRELSLPIFPEMTAQELESVAAAICSFSRVGQV